jgi:GNAT superfamily N-acetyltransferase
LDEFLQRQARQNADRNLGVTHVVVERPGSKQILAYYTLVTRTVDRSIVPAKHLAAGAIGVILLGRLAVDSASQGQGLRQMMLLRALRQAEEASRVIGVYALVLDAMDADALRWYLSLGWGFQSLRDDPPHLFLAVDTIRELAL